MKIKASEIINLAETHVTVTHLSVCKHPKYTDFVSFFHTQLTKSGPGTVPLLSQHYDASENSRCDHSMLETKHYPQRTQSVNLLKKAIS